MHNDPPDNSVSPAPTHEPRLAVLEALSRRRKLSARYNGVTVELAPHMLFERFGELFLGALNLGKAWRSDDERRVGQFKLDGLRDVSVAEEGFEPLPGFDPALPSPADTLILAI